MSRTEPPPRAGPLAIVAGGGTLPLEVAAACRREVVMLRLRGAARREAARWPGGEFDILDLDGISAAAHSFGAAELTFAGAVMRPGFAAVSALARAKRKDPAFAAAFQGGDDQMLRRVIAAFEGQGHRVVGVGEVAPGLLAPEGVVVDSPARAGAAAAMIRGRDLLRALSPFDVGQACVVVHENVLAVEAAEGTRLMLRRVAMLRQPGLLALWRRGRRALGEASGGVLVKVPKPDQDRRVDLPVIGPATVAEAVAARLDGIAVEAGAVVILERDRTVAAARAAGVFLFGLAP